MCDFTDTLRTECFDLAHVAMVAILHCSAVSSVLMGYVILSLVIKMLSVYCMSDPLPHSKSKLSEFAGLS